MNGAAPRPTEMSIETNIVADLLSGDTRRCTLMFDGRAEAGSGGCLLRGLVKCWLLRGGQHTSSHENTHGLPRYQDPGRVRGRAPGVRPKRSNLPRDPLHSGWYCVRKRVSTEHRCLSKRFPAWWVSSVFGYIALVQPSVSLGNPPPSTSSSPSPARSSSSPLQLAFLDVCSCAFPLCEGSCFHAKVTSRPIDDVGTVREGGGSYTGHPTIIQIAGCWIVTAVGEPPVSAKSAHSTVVEKHTEHPPHNMCTGLVAGWQPAGRQTPGEKGTSIN
ncbi:hypothetical protein Tco_0304092 [Tanacetum coccineum]